jgi:hypothetical protein
VGRDTGVESWNMDAERGGGLADDVADPLASDDFHGASRHHPAGVSAEVQGRVTGLHSGPEAPQVTHYIAVDRHSRCRRARLLERV